MDRDNKRPLDIDEALDRIESSTRDFPKAALFQLAEEGFGSVFQQLVACMISIRTRDETTLPVSRELFARAGTPQEMLELEPDEIEHLIRQSTFSSPKSRQIHEVARRAVEELDGELPCDGDLLQSFSGVGPKCANLTLGIACGQPSISVDVHVHRVTNRWGYIQTRSPEQSTFALFEKVPEEHWVDINRLLMPFGKHICTGTRPRCSTCPVLDMCQQVGVTGHR